MMSIPFKLSRISQIIGLDPRSMALFRVAIATIALYDLGCRFFLIEAFYTDAGVLPRSELKNVLSPWSWSLMRLSGDYWFQAFLFMIAILSALAMLVGYRTRIAIFILWVILCSIHFRLPGSIHGGDNFLRLMLFWSLFVPLNLRFSIDKLQGRTMTVSPHNSLCFSFGALGLLLQIGFMYFFSAIWKWGPVWHEEGSALYYALSIDMYAKPLGTYLLEFPQLLQLLTFATLIIELLGPLLIFFPFFASAIRFGLVAVFICFHLGIHLTMTLATFPFVCMAAWLILLPRGFWTTLSDSFGQRLKELLKLLRTRPSLTSFCLKQTALKSSRIEVYGWKTDGIALFFVGIVFSLNAFDVVNYKAKNLSLLEIIQNLTFTGQNWKLFASPLTYHGWYVYDKC
jgi:hypothetical protein